MGVDYYTCDKCLDTFPDCGPHQYCGDHHFLCPGCMVDEIHIDDDTGELENEHCPVCQAGGTEAERLRKKCAVYAEALREVADMASKLRDMISEKRALDGLIDIEAHAIGSLAEAPPKAKK